MIVIDNGNKAGIIEIRPREKVMIPRPPSWTRSSMINLPKSVKSLAVSRTMRPVTQTADVEVNIASIQPILLTVEIGSKSRVAPKKIRAMKLKKT